MSSDAGGFVQFNGRVRKFNLDKEVDHLFYEAHIPLAKTMFDDLAMRARNLFSVTDMAACHRLGRVDVGEDAVIVSALAKHRREAFLAARFLIDELKATLPIWKKEVYVDGSHAFAEHHKQHDDLSLLPPRRALQARGINVDDLKTKKIIIIGAGGLGCPLAISLCSLGFTKLSIIDGDVVEASNIARQFIFTPHDVGLQKVEVMKRFLEERYHNCHLEIFPRFMNESWARENLPSYDLVIDASDDVLSKNMVKALARSQGFSLISANVYQSEGDVQVYEPGGEACLLCFNKEITDARSCAAVGVLTHACGIVANVACEKALSLLSKRLPERCSITIIDPCASVVKTVKIAKDSRCRSCSNSTAKPVVKLVRFS